MMMPASKAMIIAGPITFWPKTSLWRPIAAIAAVSPRRAMRAFRIVSATAPPSQTAIARMWKTFSQR